MSSPVFSVTETLAAHMSTAGGLAAHLRGQSPSVARMTKLLYQSGDDFQRRRTALTIAHEILSQHDAEEYEAFLFLLAKQELQRVQGYEKQREHTVHVVYLYLLGIWFFDNIPEIRSAFEEQYRNDNSGWQLPGHPLDHRDLYRCFHFQWMFASLLHDIGYIFENLIYEGSNEDIDQLSGLSYGKPLKSYSAN